jgi:hypothetical protein
MLRIAVCDDIDTELRSIAALANEYLSTRGLNAELRAFSHPDTLLTVCEKRELSHFSAGYGYADGQRLRIRA